MGNNCQACQEQRPETELKSNIKSFDSAFLENPSRQESIVDPETNSKPFLFFCKI